MQCCSQTGLLLFCFCAFQEHSTINEKLNEFQRNTRPPVKSGFPLDYQKKKMCLVNMSLNPLKSIIPRAPPLHMWHNYNTPNVHCRFQKESQRNFLCRGYICIAGSQEFMGSHVQQWPGFNSSITRFSPLNLVAENHQTSLCWCTLGEMYLRYIFFKI